MSPRDDNEERARQRERKRVRDGNAWPNRSSIESVNKSKRHSQPYPSFQAQNNARTSELAIRERNSPISSDNSTPQASVYESRARDRPSHQSISHSLQRPPESITHVNQASESQPASAETLNALGRNFAAIPVTEYEECRRFIERNPQVLEHDPKLYFRAAEAALLSQNRSYARSCVQQGLLLREVRDKSSTRRQHFLELLAEEDEYVLDDFVENFDRYFNTLRRQISPQAVDAARSSSTTLTASQISSGMSRKHTPRLHTDHVEADNHASQSGPTEITYGTSRHHAPDIYVPDAGRIERQRHGLGERGLSSITPNDRTPLAQPGSYRLNDELKPRNSQFTASNPATSRNLEGTQNRHDNSVGSVARNVTGSQPLANYTIASRRQGRGQGSNLSGYANTDRSSLDGRFWKRSPPEAGGFFKVGRVFTILWHEPAGNRSNWSAVGRFNEKIHSEIRYMVVVREYHGYCWAIPISTYEGQGVAKSGLNQDNIDGHAVIHMVDTDPYTSKYEPEMIKRPIRVVPVDEEQTLHEMSRINFRKVHTVEHNVKVMHVGQIAEDSRTDFKDYWEDQGFPPSRRRNR